MHNAYPRICARHRINACPYMLLRFSYLCGGNDVVPSCALSSVADRGPDRTAVPKRPGPPLLPAAQLVAGGPVPGRC